MYHIYFPYDPSPKILELRQIGFTRLLPGFCSGAKVLALSAGMDDEELTKEFLQRRIGQLELERDVLRKDVEQLCIQQAGPSYLVVATRMHFHRTAALEQEIEILKKKLAVLLREKSNIQEELSEAYRIKTHLAVLHNAEVLKNKEAEGQLKFFQSCVATAFSERDHSLMESEKAKDREEAILEKLRISQRRVEELESAYCRVNERHNALVNELGAQKERIEYFEKVIDKFYVIHERDAGPSSDHTWQSKCSCLLDDSSDKWSFNSDCTSTSSNYIASLEEEVDSRKQAMEMLQNNLRMGIQIEQHLKRSVRFFEKKHMQLIELFENGLSSLHHIYNQHRTYVVKILEEEKSHWDEILLEFNETMLLSHLESEPKHKSFQEEAEQLSVDSECKDVHVADDVDCNLHKKGGDILSSAISSRMDNTSDALSQALQEKVATLLLLSQQEERHLLERETNVALLQKMDELRRNLSQVTNEKIGALMELAQLKREYELLQESITFRQREWEGTLPKILKKTSLLRWVGKSYAALDTKVRVGNESNVTANENYSMDFARLKVDHAALKESISNMEHLASSVHRLHVSLLKVNADSGALGSSESMDTLENITAEANRMRAALGSSLPVSWFSDPAANARTYESLCEPVGPSSEPRSDRAIRTVGFEMIELLILAAQFVKGTTAQTTSTCS